MSSLNGGHRMNGKVGPSDDNPVERERSNTHVDEPNIIVQPNEYIVTENSIHQSRENDQSQKQNKPQVPKLKAFEIYRFADKWDIFLMIFGTLFALATGTAMPLAMWLFESVLNSLLELGKGNSTSTKSSNCYRSLLSKNDPHLTITGLIPWYAAIGAASIVLHWLAYSFWMIACERQLRRIRYSLFRNILRQEIDWFDRRAAGELTSRLVDGLENIREGMGFRVADFICLLSRIISSIIFSFYIGWKLTLVFLSVSPLVILAFVLIFQVARVYNPQEDKAYSKANSIAQEVLGAIKTVTTFGGQQTETKR